MRRTHHFAVLNWTLVDDVDVFEMFGASKCESQECKLEKCEEG